MTLIINDNGVRRPATAEEAVLLTDPGRQLRDARRAAIALVNEEAHGRIAALWGKATHSAELLYAQLNAQTHAALLLERRGTAAEQPGDAAEIAALQTMGQMVLAIRDASNAICADIDAGAPDPAAVEAIIAAIPTDPRWP